MTLLAVAAAALAGLGVVVVAADRLVAHWYAPYIEYGNDPEPAPAPPRARPVWLPDPRPLNPTPVVWPPQNWPPAA